MEREFSYANARHVLSGSIARTATEMEQARQVSRLGEALDSLMGAGGELEHVINQLEGRLGPILTIVPEPTPETGLEKVKMHSPVTVQIQGEAERLQGLIRKVYRLLGQIDV